MRALLNTFLFIILLASCRDNGQVSSTSNNKDPEKIQKENLSSLIGKDFMIDDQHSYIGFKIKYFGFSPVRGRFDTFDGTLFYDTSNVTTLSSSIYVDVKSINTGNTQRDKDLTSDSSWFNADLHPFITFQSSQVHQKADQSFDLEGVLSMNGIDKTVRINFQKPTSISRDWAGNEQVDFSGRLTLNRQDFKVFGSDFWSSVMENGLTQLSDEVEIELDIHTRRPDYQKRYEDADSSNFRRIIPDLAKSQDINHALAVVDSLHDAGSLTSGMMSTIGYTLNAWNMHEEALAIFETRLALFPDKHSSYNQIGISKIHMGKTEEARIAFQKMIELNGSDSRAREYLRLLNTLSNSQ